MLTLRSVALLAVEAAPAGAGAAATGVIGALTTAPAWLIALGQAVIVVFYVLRGIDKRNQKLTAAVEEVRGELATVRGRLNGLQCQVGSPPACERP